MTTEEIKIIETLSRCKMGSSPWSKNFVGSMETLAKNTPGIELSESQKEWLYRLIFKYRRQVPILYAKYQLHPQCRPKQRAIN